MINLPEPAALHQPLRQPDRRRKPVIETNHMSDSCSIGSIQHFAGICQIQRQRLLTENMLACLSRRQGDLLMRITRSVDIDEINIIPGDQLLPVRYTFRPAQLISRCSHRFGIPAANNGHLRLQSLREEHRQTAVGVTVGLAHKFVADHSNTKLFHLTPP
ncbi:hypothetical protein D3C75_901480 [compost metagenome]